MARKNGRRASGEGSVYRRADGRWCGQYVVESADGSTKRRYVYGKTKGEASARLREAMAARDAGISHEGANLALGEYLDRWLEGIRDTVRDGTYKQYEQCVRLHLKPTLGGVRLGKLDALRLQALYRAKLDAGLSARRVRYVHVTVHKALKDAVRWRLVPHNAAAAATPPRVVRPEISPLDREQVGALLRAAEADPLEALYVVAVTTGMRIGEIFGLKWRDLDLDLADGTLRVRRTVFSGAVNPPKTASGRRTIRLSGLALDALKRHGERRSERRGREGDWVFASAAGTSIDICNFHKASWKPLLRRAGLPHARVHDLRHTAATLLLGRGVPVKVVSEMLGHADVSTTLSIYAHMLPDMQGATARAMDLMLGDGEPVEGRPALGLVEDEEERAAVAGDHREEEPGEAEAAG